MKYAKRIVIVASLVGLAYFVAVPFIETPPSFISARRMLMRLNHQGLPRYTNFDETEQAWFLKKMKGAVTHFDKKLICPHCDAPFIWKSIPPSGERIQISPPPERPIFFVCCSKTGWDGKRVFMFSAPKGRKTYRRLSDDEVSWHFQRLKSDLTKEERNSLE